MSGSTQAITIVPDMGTFAADLISSAVKAAEDAGKAATETWKDAFKLTDKGKAESLVKELTKAQEDIGRLVEQQSRATQKARASEAEATARVSTALQALRTAQAQHGATSAEARVAEDQHNAALLRHAAAAAEATRSERDLQGIEHQQIAVSHDLAAANGDLGRAIVDQSTAWGSVKSGLTQAKGLFGDTSQAVGGMVTKLTEAFGATELFAGAWSGSLDLEGGLAKATVALDLTAAESEKAGQVAGSLYSSAYGDSLSGVSDSITTVMSIMPELRDASASDLEAVTASALSLSDALGVDVTTSTSMAASLLRDGLAPDAMSAFDLMVGALQRVPETMQGDFMTAASEYSSTFSRLGLTGEQAFGAMIGAMEGGQVSFSTTGTALETLAKNATSMSDTSMDAYAQAGLSAEDMAARFGAGGESASGALADLVDGLLGIEDPATRAKAATDLFGELPEGEVDAFLGSLSSMDSQLGEVTGKATEMNETMGGTAANNIEELKRSFSGFVTEGLQPLIEPAIKVLDWITEIPGGIETFAIVLGTLTAAWKVYTIAQWAANAGMLANPMVLIITGIVAAIGLLAAGITLIVKNWDDIVAWFQETWEPVGEWFSTVWSSVTDIFSTAWEGIQEVAQTVVTWFQENVQPVFEAVWNGIQVAVETVVLWFQENVLPVFETVWNGICEAADIAWTVLQVVFVSIATAFTLVGEGLLWVWENLILPTWEALKTGATALWDWIDDFLIQPLVTAWNWVGDAISWVINNVIVPVWDWLKTSLATGWNLINEWVIQPLVAAWNWVGDAISWVINEIILPVWDWLSTKLQEGWEFINEFVIQAFINAWNAVGTAFSWVKDNVIVPVWEGIKSALELGWNFINDYVFEPIKNGVDAVGKSFDATKDFITEAWGKIKAAAAAPVNFIIETVYTNGIKKTWDSIAAKVGLDLKLPAVSPITFADGSEDHRAQIAPAGAWRVWAEPETGGEAYIPLSAAKRGRSTSILSTVAHQFGYQLQPFADGGFWGDVWDNVSGAASAAWNWGKDAAGSIGRFLSDPLGAMGELITKPMTALFGGPTMSQAAAFGELVAGVPRKVVSSMVDWVKGLVDGKKSDSASGIPPASGGGGAGMGHAAMWNIVRSAFPDARLHSAQRNGAVTAVGTKSLHSMGRAIDINPSMNIFNWLKSSFPNSTELIYSPAGGAQVYKGRNFLYREPTKSMHYNHVHWGFADGGLWKGGNADNALRRTLYDSGGLLQPGLTLVENKTGKPEPVLTSDEFDRLTARRDETRYELTVNNHERPLTARDIVSATRQVELLNPRR